MGYYAYGDGTATLKENVDHELFECFLKYKVRKYTILEFDICENNEITFNGEERYEEENTLEFLNALAPHITKGEIVYSGEDNSVWKFIFDPVSNEWIRQDAVIDFNFESYSDGQLIEEITKRGYEVKKKINKFTMNVETDKLPDSMCFDSETQICEYHDTNSNHVEIKVCGNVEVYFNGEQFNHYSDMPKELQQLFQDDKAEYDNRVVIEKNNWYEMTFNNEKRYSKTVNTIQGCTSKDLEKYCKMCLNYFKFVGANKNAASK